MLAIAIMLVGIGFVALVTAFIAERFIQQDVETIEEGVEDRDDQILAELRGIRERLDQLEQRG